MEQEGGCLPREGSVVPKPMEKMMFECSWAETVAAAGAAGMCQGLGRGFSLA